MEIGHEFEYEGSLYRIDGGPFGDWKVKTGKHWSLAVMLPHGLVNAYWLALPR